MSRRSSKEVAVSRIREAENMLSVAGASTCEIESAVNTLCVNFNALRDDPDRPALTRQFSNNPILASHLTSLVVSHGRNIISAAHAICIISLMMTHTNGEVLNKFDSRLLARSLARLVALHSADVNPAATVSAACLIGLVVKSDSGLIPIFTDTPGLVTNLTLIAVPKNSSERADELLKFAADAITKHYMETANPPIDQGAIARAAAAAAAAFNPSVFGDSSTRRSERLRKKQKLGAKEQAAKSPLDNNAPG